MSPRGTTRPGPVGQEVSAILRERMGRLRITQADLVRETGLDQGRLSRMLADERVIHIDELDLVTRALKTDAAEVLNSATKAARPGG